MPALRRIWTLDDQWFQQWHGRVYRLNIFAGWNRRSPTTSQNFLLRAGTRRHAHRQADIHERILLYRTFFKNSYNPAPKRISCSSSWLKARHFESRRKSGGGCYMNDSISAARSSCGSTEACGMYGLPHSISTPILCVTNWKYVQASSIWPDNGKPVFRGKDSPGTGNPPGWYWPLHGRPNSRSCQ